MLPIEEKEIRNYACIFSTVQKEIKEKPEPSELEIRSRWNELERIGKWEQDRMEGRKRGETFPTKSFYIGWTCSNLRSDSHTEGM